MTDDKLKKKRSRGRPKGSTKASSRIALLRASIDAFGDRGFDGASLKQISDSVGTDVALTRYYFGSKEALWRASIDYLAEQLSAEIQKAFSTEQASNADTMKSAIRWFVDMSGRWPQLSRIIVFEGNGDSERREYVIEKLVRPFYMLMEILIRGAKAEGAIKDVSPRTLFFMITHGGSFPMAMPELTNAFPGGDIKHRRNLKAHADSIIALIFDE